MAVLRFSIVLVLITPSLGCQLTYYMHSAYHQTKLIQSRVPIERALKSEKLNDEQKRKLKLVGEVKKFAETQLGLASSQNYTTYVALDEPFVTYIVQAAYPYELKPYLWRFPLVGKVPYKGYFTKSRAEDEAAELAAKNFDVFTRGVSAYSTLGWLHDSVLSSMLRYEDYDLVELIIHETIHTTLYVKSAAEFNERMATFLGRQGMILFYKERGGAEELKMAADDEHDQKLFSEFLTREVEALKQWYADNTGQVTEGKKAGRLREIQSRFTKEVRPKMRTKSYEDFEKKELNNAKILAYRTYEYSLDDFAKLYRHFGEDFGKTLAWLMGLKSERDPEKRLRDFVAALNPVEGGSPRTGAGTGAGAGTGTGNANGS